MRLGNRVLSVVGVCIGAVLVLLEIKRKTATVESTENVVGAETAVNRGNTEGSSVKPTKKISTSQTPKPGSKQYLAQKLWQEVLADPQRNDMAQSDLVLLAKKSGIGYSTLRSARVFLGIKRGGFGIWRYTKAAKQENRKNG